MALTHAAKKALLYYDGSSEERPPQEVHFGLSGAGYITPYGTLTDKGKEAVEQIKNEKSLLDSIKGQ